MLALSGGLTLKKGVTGAIKEKDNGLRLSEKQ